MFPLQAVCRSLWSGFGCEWAADQGGPAGVPGGDESSLPGHADGAVWHHERTGLTMQWPMSFEMYFISALWLFFFYFAISGAWHYEHHILYMLFFSYDFIIFSASFTTFSHCSFKKVFLHPAPPLSLTALCPLFIRLVCHVIKFPHETHLVTLRHAYCTLSFRPYLSLSKSIQEPNC